VVVGELNRGARILQRNRPAARMVCGCGIVVQINFYSNRYPLQPLARGLTNKRPLVTHTRIWVRTGASAKWCGIQGSCRWDILGLGQATPTFLQICRQSSTINLPPVAVPSIYMSLQAGSNTRHNTRQRVLLNMQARSNNGAGRSKNGRCGPLDPFLPFPSRNDQKDSEP
jgi:hypothetical protein